MKLNLDDLNFQRDSEMAKKKQVRNTVTLECCVQGHFIKLVDGPRPYLWIGPAKGAGPTFGVVADDDVLRLKRFCERVLAKRS